MTRQSPQAIIAGQIENATTLAAAAELLLMCPASIILHQRAVLERACRRRGLMCGVDYLDDMAATLAAVRKPARRNGADVPGDHGGLALAAAMNGAGERFVQAVRRVSSCQNGGADG